MTSEIPVLLIVQEDPAFSALTANIAAQCGYEPRIVGSSKEFSRAYRDAQPRVVCMELFMPDLDGMEMVNWLIAEKSRSPVIMTAKNTPEIAQPAVLLAEASNLFTVTVLAQPVGPARLQEALEAALHAG